MRRTVVQVAIVAVPVVAVVGVVAALIEAWALAGVAVIVLLVMVAGLVVLAMRELAGTKASIARIERRLEAAGARGLAIDEHVRADLTDRLDQLAEATRAIAATGAAPVPDHD